MDVNQQTGRTRRHQLHVWLSDREYAALQTWASRRDETMAATLRRLLRIAIVERGASISRTSPSHVVVGSPELTNQQHSAI